MDPFVMLYYAVVCGALSAVIPRFASVFMRVGIGAAVGVVAAFVLPLLQAALAP